MDHIDADAIDRKAVIEGAGDGYGAPIGSHYVPGGLGFVDTTGINPFNIEKAKALLAEAGIKTPLELSLKLPPPPYARQGGEVVKVARIEGQLDHGAGVDDGTHDGGIGL